MVPLKRLALAMKIKYLEQFSLQGEQA